MKTQQAIMALSICFMACHPKTENAAETENNTEYDMPACEMTLAEPAYNMPSPRTTANFTPQVIKDDVLYSKSETGVKKSDRVKTKKIIKDGSISIKVNEVEPSKKYMDQLVKTYHAYYEIEQFSNSEMRSVYDLKIRIPAKQFEAFLKATEKGEGEMMSKVISARDVTEDYVDGEIRLRSKHLFRNRYNQLLEKAAKVDDILAIEENIRTLQEEIESQEGRLKFLDDQILYSTIDITLYKEKIIDDKPMVKDSFFKRLVQSISNGWETFVNALLWLTTQWIWGILLLAIVFSIKFYLKKRKTS